uniref:alpha-L-rhamnosidase n=1 Tax=Chlamydomonas leiostraca TaxID=1034604 RepID=A0A7S0WGF7_9CHLO
MATGFVGTRDLLPCLARACGRPDLAHALLRSDAFPSWGYEAANGATSVWERWNGWTPEAGFNDPRMNSFSHYAYGAVGAWVFHDVGGVAPAAPGWARATVAPCPDPAAVAQALQQAPGGGGGAGRGGSLDVSPRWSAAGTGTGTGASAAQLHVHGPQAHAHRAPGPSAPIRWARTELRTPRGPLVVAWRLLAGGRFLLHLSVPPGMRAQVRLPHIGAGPHVVAEGGAALPTTYAAPAPATRPQHAGGGKGEDDGGDQGNRGELGPAAAYVGAAPPAPTTAPPPRQPKSGKAPPGVLSVATYTAPTVPPAPSLVLGVGVPHTAEGYAAQYALRLPQPGAEEGAAEGAAVLGAHVSPAALATSSSSPYVSGWTLVEVGSGAYDFEVAPAAALARGQGKGACVIC